MTLPVEVIIDADKSFIGGWILPDTRICDELIDHFERNDRKRPGEILRGHESLILKDVKDSIDLPLSPNDGVSLRYLEIMQTAVEEYKKKYVWSNMTAAWRIEAVNLQKYNPGGAYFEWHFERMSSNYIDGGRHLVFMTYLNDVTDAGETEFFYQNVKVKPQKGLTLIWPVDWTHTHRGCPSLTETKYIVTGWFRFVDE